MIKIGKTKKQWKPLAPPPGFEVERVVRGPRGKTYTYIPTGAVKRFVGIKKLLAKAGLVGGGVAVITGGTLGAQQLYEKIIQPTISRRNLKKALEYDPSLKEHDPVQVESRMRTLQKFDPEFAADPLVASSFIRQTLEYPVITPALLSDLKRPDTGVGVAAKITKDVAKALKDVMLMGGAE